MLASKPWSMRASKVYKVKCKFYDHLGFLADSTTPRRTYSTMNENDMSPTYSSGKERSKKHDVPNPSSIMIEESDNCF